MFEEVLRESLVLLKKAKEASLIKDFVLIGGLAVSAWSIPRATADIDFAVSSPQLETLSDFLHGELRLGQFPDPLKASISFQLQGQFGAVPVQLVQFPPAWEKEIFHQPELEKFGEVQMPLCHWSSLVLLKLYAGGPVDIQDAKGLLQAHPPSSEELSNLRLRATQLRVSKKLDALL